jgi:hypothetical protein
MSKLAHEDDTRREQLGDARGIAWRTANSQPAINHRHCQSGRDEDGSGCLDVGDSDEHAARARGGEEFSDRPSGNASARIDHRDAVAHSLGLVEQVTRNDDGAPFGGQRDEKMPDLRDSGWVQPICWFIKNHNLRVAQQRGSDDEPLPHPERVRRHRIIGTLPGAGCPKRPLNAVRTSPVQPGEQCEVAPPGQRRRQTRRLDQCPDLASHTMQVVAAVHVEHSTTALCWAD